MRAIRLLLAGVMAASCAPGPASRPAAPASDARAAVTSESLRALFAAEWDEKLREDPVYASRLGDRRFDDRWPDVSRAALDRRRRPRARRAGPAPRDGSRRPSAGGPSELSPLPARARAARRGPALRPRAPRRRSAAAASRTSTTSRPRCPSRASTTTRPGSRACARCPPTSSRRPSSCARGSASTSCSPASSWSACPAQIDEQIVDDPEKSPFFSPLERFPASMPAADRERLVHDARAAIAAGVVPAYRRFEDFFAHEYLPACFPAGGRMAAAARRRGLRVPGAHAHDDEHPPGRGARPRPARGRAHPRRDARARCRRSASRARCPDFFAWLRTDPQFFYADPQRALRGLRRHGQAHRPAARARVPHAPAHALRGRAHPRRASRPTRRPPTTASRQPTARARARSS